MCFCYIIQLRPRQQATDSSFCRTALLGFAIPFNNVAAIHAGDNQRDQGEGLPPLTLSLRFSPSWLPLSLPTPVPRWGVGQTRIITRTLYVLLMRGRLTLHVRRLVHISQVSGVFLKSQCQCSCTDILTKILTPCRYVKCFKRCWRYILMYSFNNRFIDSLTPCSKFARGICQFTFILSSTSPTLSCMARSALLS